jgi:hypothetical protein
MTAICDRCREATSTKRDGRYGKFLHIRCVDAWWKSEYEWTGGAYYLWMREGMCVR